MDDLEKFFLSPEATLEEAMKTIQRGGEGIALVVDKDRHLIGTVTDGDLRRAVLNRFPLLSCVQTVMAHRPSNYAMPTAVVEGTPVEQIIQLMRERVVRQIPILDSNGRVIDIALLSKLLTEEQILPITAVVMAGGEGQRLRPLTAELPKPMLPLNDRPLMQHTIEQLRQVGVRRVAISTHYKSEVITNHFGDGKDYGVTIDYITEQQPLGTAGALSLMERPTQPTLVVNGDIVTQLDFRALYDFHQTHKAIMTVGVRIYEFMIPYGVISTDDIQITDLTEKPMQNVVVNAGIYLLEPAAFEHIPRNTPFHMTDLIHRLLQEGQSVVSFPIQEYWLDVGQLTDYQKAHEDAKQGKI